MVCGGKSLNYNLEGLDLEDSEKHYNVTPVAESLVGQP